MDGSTVLIVCDKAISVNLARALEALGYPSKVAGTLDETFKALRSAPLSIVVISSGVAGNTGVWLVGQIRKAYPEIRLILWAAGAEVRSLPGVPIVRMDYDLTLIVTAVRNAALPPRSTRSRNLQTKGVTASTPKPTFTEAPEMKQDKPDKPARSMSCPLPAECPVCNESPYRAHFEAGQWAVNYLCGSEIRIPAKSERVWERHCPKAKRPQQAK